MRFGSEKLKKRKMETENGKCRVAKYAIKKLQKTYLTGR